MSPLPTVPAGKTPAVETLPEASPLWGIVLILGEIAGRVERRQAGELGVSVDVRVAERQNEAHLGPAAAEEPAA